MSIAGVAQPVRGGLRAAVCESRDAVADLYSLVHEDAGPAAAFATLEEARNELEAVLDDEPNWITRLWIEPLALTVAENRD